MWKGIVFGGVCGRIDVLCIVDLYMEGWINIDDLIMYIMFLDDINKVFDLMYEGELICSVVLY